MGSKNKQIKTNHHGQHRGGEDKDTDSQRGDLLTSFAGHTITYDGIGNPISYHNG